jgi:O-antigen ligase
MIAPVAADTIPMHPQPWIRLSAWEKLIILGAAGALLTLGIVIAVAPLSMVTLLVAAAGLILCVVLRPVAGLCLLALLLPFSQEHQVMIAGAQIGLAELLLFLIVAAWFLRMAARRTIRVPHATLLIPYVAFVAVQALSLLSSQSLRESVPEMVKWLEMLLLYLFIASEVRHRHLPWLIGAGLMAGVTQAALGAYQFAGRVGPESFIILDRFVRAHGSFRQPNPYAGYLGLVVPVAASLMLWAARRVWSALRHGPRHLPPGALRTLLMASCLAATTTVLVAAIGMSWSRGAWLGLASSLAVVGALHSPRAAALGLLAVAIVVVTISSGSTELLSATWIGRLSGLQEYVSYATNPDLRQVEITHDNFAVLERVAHWHAAWAMFRDRPWLGVGIGNYAHAYRPYALPRWGNPLGHAHNIFLHFLAEAGILGLVSYLIWLVAALMSAWRTWRATTHLQRAIAIAALGMMAHLIVHNLVDNLYVQGIYLHVAMVLGLLPAVGAPKEPRP